MIPDTGILALPVRIGGSFSDISEAHIGKIKLDIHGLGRKLGAGLHAGKLAWLERNGDLAAKHLAAAHILQHPFPRITGEEFRPERLQHVDRHRTDLARQVHLGRPWRVVDVPGKLDGSSAGADDEARERHAARSGVTLPSAATHRS